MVVITGPRALALSAVMAEMLGAISVFVDNEAGPLETQILNVDYELAVHDEVMQVLGVALDRQTA
jgi:hypothetical protein